MKSLEELAIILEVLEDDLRTGNTYQNATRNLPASPVHSELCTTGNVLKLWGLQQLESSQSTHLHVFSPQEAVMSMTKWLPVQNLTLLTVRAQRNTTKPQLPPTACSLTFNTYLSKMWTMKKKLIGTTTTT